MSIFNFAKRHNFDAGNAWLAPLLYITGIDEPYVLQKQKIMKVNTQIAHEEQKREQTTPTPKAAFEGYAQGEEPDKIVMQFKFSENVINFGYDLNKDTPEKVAAEYINDSHTDIKHYNFIKGKI